MTLLNFQNGGPIHFVGIAGIGMSGIAEVLHTLGYQVQGSDIAENQTTKRLQDLGITVFNGHSPENSLGAMVVVTSSAVDTNNCEVVAAKSQGIPVIQRAEMLWELMRLKKSVAVSGTHGKTTTTSLVAALFDAAQLDPTVVNGGIINAYNTNARLGTSEWIVVEADESDGSFVRLHPTIAVMTNIDPEHMEHYKNFDNLTNAFEQFLNNMPFYGVGILCVDHPVVAALFHKIDHRRLVSYGFSPDAMVRAVNLRPHASGTLFDVEIKSSLRTHSNIVPHKQKIGDIDLPMIGTHNVQNALVVFALAQELGFSETIVRHALTHFKGVKRRFTKVGESHGVTIIDDYAHHPVEIKTVIQAARQACPVGNIIGVIQPHRYTRLKALMADFAAACQGCQQVIITAVYSAGEEPIEGVHSDALAQMMRDQLGIPVCVVEEATQLAVMIARIVTPGDMVLMMGAGSITYWAAALPAQLDQLITPLPAPLSRRSSS